MALSGTTQTAFPRRAALKSAVAAAAACAAVGRAPALAESAPSDETISWAEHFDHPPLLGRVAEWGQRIVSAPGLLDPVLRAPDKHEVLPILRALYAAPPARHAHNPIWFDVGEGFIHAAFVLPCREVFQPVQDVPPEGFWAEVTVPLTWQHWRPGLNWDRTYAMPYGAVFFVIERADDPSGRAWYRLFDDRRPGNPWWVQAAHLRRIEPAEFAPISPQVQPAAKRIEIDLTAQVLTCFEGSVSVFSTRVATGAVFRGHDTSTPAGNYQVLAKTPARHMRGGEENDAPYDLPGVPWCTYFSGAGFAIHGTTWHNDFGAFRSAGCINTTPDAARWIYRWTTPSVGPDHGIPPDVWFPNEELGEPTRIVTYW